jgi:hypothetical protein
MMTAEQMRCVEGRAAGFPGAGGVDVLVGLGESEAAELVRSVGWVSRVGSRDGAFFALTRDLRPDRVTFTVVDAVVVAVAVG